jgi:hypothetical protein
MFYIITCKKEIWFHQEQEGYNKITGADGTGIGQ